MEESVPAALAALKSNAVTIDVKANHLTELKQDIKHKQCPESLISPLFQCIRIALSTPHLGDAGFSILSHSTKRLTIQRQQTQLHGHTVKLFPIILDRLGDQKDRLRQRAIAAMLEVYTISDLAQKDVEDFMRDVALTNKHPRARQSAMHWICKAHAERAMLFRAFVPNIVNCLEDADGDVRQTAQGAVLQLFDGSSARSRSDLLKKMQERGVRKGIESYILSELEANDGHAALDQHSRHASPSNYAKRDLNTTTLSRKADSPLAEIFPSESHVVTAAEKEAAELSPLYIESVRDLEETFRDMQPWFEGREAESNWLKREKNVENLRRITKANAPEDFKTSFLASIKAMIDGILKTVNSLRTTVCTIGCHLVQDLARVCGSGLDGMVEILLQNLIKLCGNTKKISASNANDTVIAIMAHVSYHVKLLQHINLASQDKNVQPRIYATQWLKTILIKHGHSRHSIEHSNGLELIDKTIRQGLNDSNPTVRENMRATYWVFAKLWSDRSETIMGALSQSHQDMLIKHAANPNPMPISRAASSLGVSTFSKSVGARASRPSIKDAIAAQKRAQVTGRQLPDRPGSAADFLSPAKISAPPRPATAMSNITRHVSSSSIGTLSSAPVRPKRRPDIVRAPTADPIIARTPKTETPAFRPNYSPPKTAKPKTPAMAASVGKSSTRKLQSPASSPAKPTTVKKPASRMVEHSPTRAAEDLTMVIPSLARNMYTPDTEIPDTNRPSSADQMKFPTKAEELSRFQGPSIINQPDLPSSAPHSILSPTSHTIPTPAPTDLQYNLTTLPIVTSAASPGSLRLTDTMTISDSPVLKKPDTRPISMSPRDVMSRKEYNISSPLPLNQTDKKPLQVYEDPFSDTGADTAIMQTPVSQAQRVLGELPINEPVSQSRNTIEHHPLVRELHSTSFSASDPNSTESSYHKSWQKIKQAEYKQVDRVDKDTQSLNPLHARRLLESGIVRIRTNSLDMHGYRKLQSLIATAPQSIWDDSGQKLQELLLPLLDQLEGNTAAATTTSRDIKVQILVVLKLLMATQAEAMDTWYPATLAALCAARKHHKASSHIVSGLEEAAEDCVARCLSPADCVTALLDLIDVDTHPATLGMGLYTLSGLLHQCHVRGASETNGSSASGQKATIEDSTLHSPNSKDRNGISSTPSYRNSHNGMHAEMDKLDLHRMAALARKYLDSTNPDLRRALMEVVMELHSVVEAVRGRGEDAAFWSLLAPVRAEQRGLITYYLARHRAVHV